jgi:putative motility protein YjfB-like
MDIMSMISSVLAAQAGNTQMQVATSLMRSNIDAEKSAMQTLLGAPTGSSQANLGPGIGGNLDIAA